MTERERLIKHAKTKYASSPIEFTDEELDVIEHDDFKCWRCGKSVFEMDDYPAVRDGGMFCEECFIEEFYETCPMCEEHYEPKEDDEEYFFITKRTAEITGKPVGMYKVLEHPFFWGDCVTGFDAFYDGAIEQVNDFDIEEYLKQQNRFYDYDTVPTEIICPDCAKKYLEIVDRINKTKKL